MMSDIIIFLKLHMSNMIISQEIFSGIKKIASILAL